MNLTTPVMEAMHPHVLILDADLSAAQVTRAGIQRAWPDATLAIEPDPESGWRSVQDHQPDILIIDPAPQGLASAWLVQAFKQLCPRGHVIVLSSAPTPGLRWNKRQAYIDAYLEKPAPLAQIVQEVRAALEDPPVRPNGASA